MSYLFLSCTEQFFKKNIAALQIHYRNTQSNYDAIINRLKVIE